MNAAVSRSQQARFRTRRLWAVVKRDGVTTMIQPIATLPTTVTAAAVVIHAIAALFNVDSGEVAFSSKSKSHGVTFDVTLSVALVNMIELLLQVAFMTPTPDSKPNPINRNQSNDFNALAIVLVTAVATQCQRPYSGDAATCVQLKVPVGFITSRSSDG